MRCAEVRQRLGRAVIAALAAVLTCACSGGNSSQTTLVLGDGSTQPGGPTVSVDQPTGPNTTEVVVDTGPTGGFSLGVTNLAYVTVTVCTPGSTTACVSVDHVLLDTGSIGLRLMRSALGGLPLPPQQTAQGAVTECFPFVVGAVWGPMAAADLHIGGETAPALPMQIIEDSPSPQVPATAECQASANGNLLDSVARLQANGVLGIGMLRYDCGLVCEQGSYSSGYTLYYTCPAGGACQPAAVPAAQQVQNPVSSFAADGSGVADDNGTIIVLPAVPTAGAALARGRLVFGIGTRANNQLQPATQVLHVDTNPANSSTYLYLATTVDGTRYDSSYIDSGSNGLFFDDPTLSTQCSASGTSGSWYCPASVQQRSATLTDVFGTSATVPLAIANADGLFKTANTAFADLAGVAGSPGAFVWGLPFFFGRPVYTAIWGQALAQDGPWNGF